jgi:hypothetical protein
MRELADAERIRRFMRAAGAAAARDGVCYLAGGATAVLLGWRGTTIDVASRSRAHALLSCRRGRRQLTGAVVLPLTA